MNAIAQTFAGFDPLLLPDRDEPYFLHDVFEKVIDGCRDEIVLSFGDCCLSFKVDLENDTVKGQFNDKKLGSRRGYRSIGRDEPWKQYLNEVCGWTWLAINQQGYWDTILLSFDSVVPNILLNVMASSIHVFAVRPLPGSPSDRKRPKRTGASVK